MKYRFYVNAQKDENGDWVGFIEGYKPGHALHLVHQGEVTAASDDQHACEYLFGQFNINHPANYRDRSMSVGDVVVLDDARAYACTPLGFKPVAVPEPR